MKLQSTMYAIDQNLQEKSGHIHFRGTVCSVFKCLLAYATSRHHSNEIRLRIALNSRKLDSRNGKKHSRLQIAYKYLLH